MVSKRKKKGKSKAPSLESLGIYRLYRLPAGSRYEAKLNEDGVTMGFRDLFNSIQLNTIPSGPAYHSIDNGIIVEVGPNFVVVESYADGKLSARKKKYLGRRPRGGKFVRVKVGPLERARKLTFAASVLEIGPPVDHLKELTAGRGIPRAMEASGRESQALPDF